MDRPIRVQKVEAPRYQDNRLMEVRLSTLGTGRLYPARDTLAVISVGGGVDSRDVVRPEGFSEISK